MKPLIIIPARGGSKGIPHKNRKLLWGYPLIAYSIEIGLQLLRKLQLPKENLIVSTDDSEIAKIAADFGAPTSYLRPVDLATDTAGSREVILHAMDWAENQGVEYDAIVLLQPTSPFRALADVEGVMQLYEASNPDMAVSVKESASNPYYNCFEADYGGVLHVAKGDGMLTRRQDAPKAWEFNGAVYVIRPQSLRAMPMGAFPKRVGYEMPAERSVDLDTTIDWIVAEAMIEKKLVQLPFAASSK